MRSGENVVRYPMRRNRYSPFGWNRNFQYCYNQEDIHLLAKIVNEYNLLSEEKKEDYFKLLHEKQWREWWECHSPSYQPLLHRLEAGSFTLASRESKDAKAFPLWSYADNMARQIANWQGERIRNQNFYLHNDPVMLVFEELKDWFFTSLAETQCKKDSMHHIARRQNYLNNLIHIIPNFGPDKLYLHEIQQVMEEALKIITACIANKELPHLLSDLVIAGKSLETAVGTYLHFLLINEEVADNFSSEYIDGGQRNCNLSPICKLYRAAQNSQSLIPFYEQITIAGNNHQYQLSLKTNLTKLIQFSTDITEEQKGIYIEAVATLESLIKVRKVLQRFQEVLPRLGTYIFAVNYLESVDTLSRNYINLVNKEKILLGELIKAADDSLHHMLLRSDNDERNVFFEKNYRALKTRVASPITVSAQLETYCVRAIDNMHKYQQEMKKLVRHVNSGQASQELEMMMRDLFHQMGQLNIILPAITSRDSVVTLPLATEQCRFENSINLPQLEAPDIHRQPDNIMQTSSAARVQPGIFTWAKLGWDYIKSPSFSSTATIFSTLPSVNSPPQNTATQSRSTESSFNRSLSLNEVWVVGRYILHYLKKYSWFTLPWNRMRSLTDYDMRTIHRYEHKLKIFKTTFQMQLTNSVAKSNICNDQYLYVEKTLFALSRQLKQINKTKQVSQSLLDDIKSKIVRISEVIHQISLYNRQHKKILVTERRLHRRNQCSTRISILHRDVIHHRLQHKFTSVINRI